MRSSVALEELVSDFYVGGLEVLHYQHCYSLLSEVSDAFDACS